MFQYFQYKIFELHLSTNVMIRYIFIPNVWTLWVSVRYVRGFNISLVI